MKILIIILLAVIAAPIAIVGGCFLTDTGKDMSTYDTYDQNTLISNKMANAINGVNSSKALTFTFDADNLNGLLYNVYNTNIAPTNYGQYLKKFYCDYDKDSENWTFTVVAGWNFLNTQVKLPMKLSSKDDNFTFEVSAPIIGRVNLGFLEKYVKQFAGKLGINNILQNALSGLGIPDIKVDLTDTGQITFSKTGLLGVVSSKIGSGTGNPFFDTLLNFYTNEGKDSLKIVTDGAIGLSLDLNDYVLEETKINDTVKKFRTNIKTYVDQVKDLKLKTVDEIKNALTNKLSGDEYKTDGSKIFTGSIRKDITLAEVQSVVSSGTSLDLGYISGSDLFNFSRTLDAIGSPTCFVQNIGTDTATISYALIDALDYNFLASKNRLNTTVIVDVNGLPLNISLDYKIESNSGTKIILGSNDLNENKIYIGSKELTGTSKTKMIEMLKNASSSSFGVNDNGSIEIDLASAEITEEAAKQELINVLNDNSCKLEFACADSATENGQLKIKLVRNSNYL